jgi:hypothetical protein
MTELKFWNTLTRAKEEFQPIDDKNVRMYVCGPTVYDYAHIGNARPLIVFDVLYRLLRHVYGESHVTYVRNITDVDDKINARALRDYPDLPLNEAIAKVTEKTADRFHKDAAALGCLEPTHEPRATAHIDGMVKMIQTLIDKGNAYVTSGREGREVLFAVSSMPGLRQAVEPQARRAAGRRPHRGGGSQAQSGRLRLVEGIGRRRARLGRQLHRERRDPDHPRTSRLAHRVLGDERASPGRDLRHPRRRTGPDLPAPRKRDRPVLLRPRQ